MKNKFTILLCALLVWSCTKESETETYTDSPLNITFTSDITTRANTLGFELNDIISVAAFSETAAISTNTLYNYDGAIFSSTTPIEYEDSDQELSFYAVYPSQESSSIMEFDFEIATDQRVSDGYEMSDLLTSTTSPTTERQPELQFYHRMSNIIINIISDDDFSDAVLTFNALNNVECNLNESTFESTGSSTTIYATTNGSTGFKAILAPQTIDANTEFATLTIGDNVYTWTLIEEFALTTGHQYICNWDVVTNDVSLTGIILDWGASDDESLGSDISYTRLSDYSATSYPTDTDEWIIYDMYTNTDDFAGLRDALNAVSYTNRKISIGFNNLVYMPSSAFYESSHKTTCLTRLTLPNVTVIDSKAFYDCTALATLNTTKLISIESSAFYGCTALTTLSAPDLVSIESQAFYNCSSLTTLTLSNVLSVGYQAFAYCTSIESLTFESLETADNYCFAYITNMKSISLPSATYLGGYVFRECTSLQEINIPNVTTIKCTVNYSTFCNCTSLTAISIPRLTSISGNSYSSNCQIFSGCTNLIDISLATESMLTEAYYIWGELPTSIATLTLGSQNAYLVDGNTFTDTKGTSTTFYKIIIED